MVALIKDDRCCFKNMKMSAALSYFVNPKSLQFVLKLPTELNLYVKWRIYRQNFICKAYLAQELTSSYKSLKFTLKRVQIVPGNQKEDGKQNMVCSDLGLWMGP